MKKLFLIRHAKSDWADPGIKDFDRPLNHRGLRDAPVMAKRLKDTLSSVDLIVSSPALRAKATAIFFSEVYSFKKDEVVLDLRIYEAGLSQLLQVVNELDDRFHTILLFGHNPGFSELTTYLGGLHIEMPTCSIAELDFDLKSWSLLSANTGKLSSFDYPKKEH